MEPHGGHPRFLLDPEKRPKLRVIDRQTVNWWKQQARQEITTLMHDKKSWYYKGKGAEQNKELKLSFSKHDIRGYTTSSPSSKTASSPPLTRKSAYFCHGVLNLSLEDIAYALYCDNTADQRTVATCLYQEAFLDAAVLDVYDRKSVEDPFHFAGTKWVAFKIPPGLVAPPDLVYFEYSCKTRDADGNAVLVQYTVCPELVSEQMDEQNIGLARAQASQVSTFRFLEEGTHCQSTGWFESSPNVPAWVASKAVQQIFSNMGHLVGLADARAIANLGSASSVSTIKACYLCSKKFGMLQKRHNCRSCGQSVCTKCTIKLKVLTSPQSEQQRLSQSLSSSASNSSPKFTEDKFCLPCVLQAREQRLHSGSFSEMVSSVSSEESNTTAPPSIDEGYDIDLAELQDSIDNLDDLSDLDDLDDPYLLDRHGPRRPQTHKHSDLQLNSSNIVFTNARRKPVSAVEAYLSSQAKDVHKKPKKRATPHPSDSIGAHYGWSAPPAIAEEEQVGPRGSRSRRQAPALSKPLPKHHLTDLTPQAQAAPAPTMQQPPCTPMPAAFSNISQSIAAQEALLQTIQQERQKFHSRRRASSEIPDLVPDNGRFEIILETS